MYVQDYGAPIGWRLALRDPDAITAIITQNGNGYEAGFVESFWAPVWAYAKRPDPQTEAAVRAGAGARRHPLAVPARRAGPRPSSSPDTWHARLRPGVPARQRPASSCALFRRLRHQPAALPAAARRTCANARFRCWRSGAQATRSSARPARSPFADDLPDAEIHLLDGGHFLLESDLDTTAGYIRGFLGATFAPAMAGM